MYRSIDNLSRWLAVAAFATIALAVTAAEPPPAVGGERQVRAAAARPSSADSVALGHRFAVDYARPPVMQMTRFERFMASPDAADDTTLLSLSDGDNALVAQVPPAAAPQPVALGEENLKKSAVATELPAPVRSESFVPLGNENVKFSRGKKYNTSHEWEWALVAAVALITCARFRILRLIDRAMFYAVSRIRFPGVAIHYGRSRSRRHRRSSRIGGSDASGSPLGTSPSGSSSRRHSSRSSSSESTGTGSSGKGRSRRHSSRRRGVDVRWYFRAAGSRNSRRRSSSRARDFVVSDVIYSTASSPAVSSPYLLTYQDN